MHKAQLQASLSLFLWLQDPFYRSDIKKVIFNPQPLPFHAICCTASLPYKQLQNLTCMGQNRHYLVNYVNALNNYVLLLQGCATVCTKLEIWGWFCVFSHKTEHKYLN